MVKVTIEADTPKELREAVMALAGGSKLSVSAKEIADAIQSAPSPWTTHGSGEAGTAQFE